MKKMIEEIKKAVTDSIGSPLNKRFNKEKIEDIINGFCKIDVSEKISIYCRYNQDVIISFPEEVSLLIDPFQKEIRLSITI